MWFISMGLCQGSGLCSSSSRKYPGTEGTNQNRHWNNHCWHATNSLEQTRLSCWCLKNHKGCIYRAPVRYVTKTRSVVLLNKKIHILLSQVYCVWQVVETPTIISNNPVFLWQYESTRHWEADNVHAKIIQPILRFTCGQIYWALHKKVSLRLLNASIRRSTLASHALKAVPPNISHDNASVLLEMSVRQPDFQSTEDEDKTHGPTRMSLAKLQNQASAVRRA